MAAVNVAGTFDGFHYGHVHALFDARFQNPGAEVAVIVSDTRCAMFPSSHRAAVVGACRFADRVEVGPAKPGPADTDNTAWRVHAWLTGRAAATDRDTAHLRGVFDLVRPRLGPQRSAVVVAGVWDILTPACVEFLAREKARHGAVEAVVLPAEEGSTVFNQLERAIAVCGLACVDRVRLGTARGGETVAPDSGLESLQDPGLWRAMVDRERARFAANAALKRAYLDAGAYAQVVRRQFCAIAHFLNAAPLKPTDVVVLDIDEVCLQNLMYTNNQCFAGAFKDRFSTGITPFLVESTPMFRALRRRGIPFAFVTGRKDAIRTLTEENLLAAGLGGYAELFTCPDAHTGPVAEFKSRCRRVLVDRGHTILCCVGDQLSDLSGPHAGVPFLVFNPFYVTE